MKNPDMHPAPTHPAVESVAWIFALIFLILAIGGVIIASGR